MAEYAKKKITVLDMSKYMDKEVRVKFMGGREVVGMLKGYDALLNLVLDETRGAAQPHARGCSTAPTRAARVAPSCLLARRVPQGAGRPL
jgi:U6 snRNA-associated Sm-like protein LSm7